METSASPADRYLCVESRMDSKVTKKTILVTGASGFIGRHLVERLLVAGYSVRAAARRSFCFPEAVDVAIIPDLSGPIDWKPVLSGVNIVIHLAGAAHVDFRDAPSDKFKLINTIATQNLALAAKEAGIEQFVFMSTVRAQVGPSAISIVREADDARPTNDYGRSKLAGEFALRASGVPFTILRPVAVYGPFPGGNVRALLQLSKTPWPLPTQGLINRRSFLGIDNFISATLFVLNTRATVGETYLVADSTAFRVSEFVAMLRKAQGRRPGLIYIPPDLLRFALILLNRGRLWPRLGEDLVVDTGKLQALGWRPIVDTYDGIVAMIRSMTGVRS